MPQPLLRRKHWPAALLVILTFAGYFIARRHQSFRPIKLEGVHGGQIAFSGDGRLLACGGGDGSSNATVQVVEVASRRITRSLSSPGGTMMSAVALSPDGTLVAAAVKGASWPGEKLPILVWNTQTGRLLHTLENVPGAGANDLAFSPDGRSLCSIRDGTVSFWDMATGSQKTVPFPQPQVGSYSMEFNGDVLLIGGIWGVWAYDLKQAKQLPVPRRGWGSICAVALSPDGTVAAASGQSPAITVWDVATGRILMDTWQPGGGSVGALAMSSDNNTLVSSGTGGVLLWRISANPYSRTLTPQSGFNDGQYLNLAPPGVFSDGQYLTISPDGSMLAASEWAGHVRLYRLR